MFDAVPPVAWQAAAVLLVTAALPFASSFVLDGVAVLLRGQGSALLWAALALCGTIVLAAALAWAVGAADPGERAVAAAADMRRWGGVLLLVTVPVSVGAFLLRYRAHLPRRTRRRGTFVPAATLAQD